jgi:hypothetical protein
MTQYQERHEKWLEEALEKILEGSQILDARADEQQG